MSAKTSAEVVIDGKVYTLSGYEGTEYLQKVAGYINDKIAEFDSLEDYRHFPLNMKATLVQLNIADDYFKAKRQAEIFEEDLEAKDREMYDLKHDLISSQVQLENFRKDAALKNEQLERLQKKIEELEQELNELLK